MFKTDKPVGVNERAVLKEGTQDSPNQKLPTFFLFLAHISEGLKYTFSTESRHDSDIIPH